MFFQRNDCDDNAYGISGGTGGQADFCVAGGRMRERICIFRRLSMNTESGQVEVNGYAVSLTAKEYAILELVLSRPKKLFSKENLFESVRHEEYILEDSTLKVHISNLRTK